MRENEIVKLAKENKIPGMDLNDPKYSGPNGWYKFQTDLQNNSQFKALLKKYPTFLRNKFMPKLRLAFMSDVAKDLGRSSARMSGNSWFQEFLDINN